MTTNTHIAAQARDLASKAARLGARRFGDELIQCLRECAQALEAASPPPAVVKPLSDQQRRQITAMWNAQNRNYTASDIIDAVEAAHGIVTEETGK